MAIRCGKRGESAFDSIDNDGQMLDADLAHKARNRADLHRALGGGTRRRAKNDRHVEALHGDIVEAGGRQDGAQPFLVGECKRSGRIRIGRASCRERVSTIV